MIIKLGDRYISADACSALIKLTQMMLSLHITFKYINSHEEIIKNTTKRGTINAQPLTT